MTLRDAAETTPFDGPEQERVRSLLGALPDPGPMPHDLVERIQARLADEAMSAGSGAPHGAHTVVDLTARRRMRVMAAIAGVGGVAAAAAVIGVLATGGLHGPESTTAAFNPSGSTTSSAPALSIRVSDANITEEGLDAEASRLLQTTGEVTPGAAESPSLGPLATQQGLADCLGKVGLIGYSRAAAELASYRSTPAVVIGARSSSGRLEAWVLSRSCVELAPHHPID